MKKIKVSDYLIYCLKKCGIDTYFGVQGGAIAHVIESSAKTCDYFPVLNEQAGGLYAHGYYFSHKKPACVLTTTGPGFLNSVTGMGACYFDNVPSVFITGQVSADLNLAKKFNTKMYGFQEVQHMDIGKNLADNNFKINSENTLKNFFEFIRNNDYKIKKSVFIEIQDAFSRSFVNFSKLNKKSFKSKKIPSVILNKFMKKISLAKNPLILVGNSFKDISNGKKLINQFSKKLNIPIAFTWGGSPLMSKKNTLNLGYFGMHNPGIANSAIQKSDLLICFGVSLLQHQAGKNKKLFSPKGKILYVNNDSNNIKRINFDFKNRVTNFNFDCIDFLKGLRILKVNKNISYRLIKNSKIENKFINKSLPVSILSNVLEEFNKKNSKKDRIIFSDAGATLSWTYQAANKILGSNIITSFNIHTMGYSIPAGIGAALKTNRAVLSIIGDGGVLMNSQELVNFCRVKNNLKILIIDNKGYGIIRQTQDDFFNSNYIGTKIGLKNNMAPYNVVNIVKSFGLSVKLANENLSLSEIKNFISSKINCLVINVNQKYKVDHLTVKNKNDYLPF